MLLCESFSDIKELFLSFASNKRKGFSSFAVAVEVSGFQRKFLSFLFSFLLSSFE